jgi:cytochrome b pre-mRNA-processing protein 3
MIFPRFRRNRRPDTISALYGMIVAQARLPIFYREYAVADTVNGRFDLLVLHFTLVIERLSAEPALHEPSQALFDRFCQDMDDNLREIGISDLKVPKEMRRIGEAFYGRAQAYRTALAADDDTTLAEAVARNVYGGAPANPALPVRLAAYMREAVRELTAQTGADLAAGGLRWPDPGAALKPHAKTAG